MWQSCKLINPPFFKAFVVLCNRTRAPNDVAPSPLAEPWQCSVLCSSPSFIKTSFLEIVDDIYDRFGHLLDSLDLSWLDPALFAELIHNKGALLEQCWGFIDGTPRPMARPTRNQHIMFSEHKRVHCIKFQVAYHSTLTSLFRYGLRRFSLTCYLVCLKF